MMTLVGDASGSDPTRSGVRAMGPALLSVGLVCGLYFQTLVFSPGLFWRDAFDGRLILWILEHGRLKLLSGAFTSYFQAMQFFPYQNSLAFSDSLIGMAPIYTVWRTVFSEIVALNLTLASILAVAAILLDRQLRALGVKPLARVLATVVALSSFPMFAVMGHFQLFGLLFVPVVLLLVARILLFGEGGLYVELFLTIGFGTAIAMYLPFMLFFVLLPIGLVYWRLVPRLLANLTMKDMVAAAAFVAAMTALMIPYIVLQKKFTPIPLPEVHFYAARLSSFFMLTPANFIYPNLSVAAGDWERSYSPGAVGIVCLVACLLLVHRSLRQSQGAVATNQQRLLVFAGLVFLLAWGLSLGPYVELFGHRIITPVGVLQKHVPSLRMIRTPGRYSVFFTLYMALVFAIGLSVVTIRGKVAALALLFCAFQVPRSDLVAREARILRDDACLATLRTGDVANIVPLASGDHLAWINARVDHMLMMLPYKARIFAGYGNRDTPEIQRITHLERLFRRGELSAEEYRRDLAGMGATHIVLLKDALPVDEAARYQVFSPVPGCQSDTISLRTIARGP